MEIIELVTKITTLTQTISDRITNSDLTNTAQCYEHRQLALKELIACYPARISKSEILTYLKVFAQREKDMIAQLTSQRAELHKTFKKFRQLRGYFSVVVE
jgi:hypothetical protein